MPTPTARCGEHMINMTRDVFGRISDYPPSVHQHRDEHLVNLLPINAEDRHSCKHRRRHVPDMAKSHLEHPAMSSLPMIRTRYNRACSGTLSASPISFHLLAAGARHT
jgi:hypothetical protein